MLCTGLSCPDYDWIPTLEAIRTVAARKSAAGKVPVEIPLVTTSNTMLEATIEQSILADAIDGCTMCESGLSMNPFVSLEALQSGTLANDIYRKNTTLTCNTVSSPEDSGWLSGIWGKIASVIS